MHFKLQPAFVPQTKSVPHFSYRIGEHGNVKMTSRLHGRKFSSCCQILKLKFRGEQSFSTMGAKKIAKALPRHMSKYLSTSQKQYSFKTALTLGLSSLEDLVASFRGTAPCSLASLKSSFTIFPVGG